MFHWIARGVSRHPLAVVLVWVLVLLAAIASLGAVGTMLLSGGQHQPQGAQVFDGRLGLSAVEGD